MNVITIVGNIGKDAEVKQYGERYKISFSVATNEKRKDGDRTDWHNVNYWSKSNGIAPYLKKGQQVAVQGAQRHDKHEEKYFASIDAYKVELIGKADNTSKSEPDEFPWE